MTSPTTTDGLVKAPDIEARYGDGLDLGVSLGGGGVFFVAWQVAYLHQLSESGVRLHEADRIVGTSAGSVVGAALASGRIDRLFHEVSLLSKAPKLVGLLAPAGDLHPSQIRARDLFAGATDASPESVRAIGHAALAAQSPTRRSWRATSGS